jgi:hypothetical protein
MGLFTNVAGSADEKWAAVIGKGVGEGKNPV